MRTRAEAADAENWVGVRVRAAAMLAADIAWAEVQRAYDEDWEIERAEDAAKIAAAKIAHDAAYKDGDA